MVLLTDFQKEILLENVFKNENHPGWRSIAKALLEKGECVVAGDTCIWVGGIGNFIRLTQHQDYFGCSRYYFDMESFLKTEWWKSFINEYVKLLEKNVNDAKIKYLETYKLYEETVKLNEYSYEQKERY